MSHVGRARVHLEEVRGARAVARLVVRRAERPGRAAHAPAVGLRARGTSSVRLHVRGGGVQARVVRRRAVRLRVARDVVRRHHQRVRLAVLPVVRAPCAACQPTRVGGVSERVRKGPARGAHGGTVNWGGVSLRLQPLGVGTSWRQFKKGWRPYQTRLPPRGDVRVSGRAHTPSWVYTGDGSQWLYSGVPPAAVYGSSTHSQGGWWAHAPATHAGAGASPQHAPQSHSVHERHSEHGRHLLRVFEREGVREGERCVVRTVCKNQ